MMAITTTTTTMMMMMMMMMMIHDYAIEIRSDHVCQRRIQGVRWVRTNPPPLRPGVVVENARNAWLYQSSSVRDIFTEIVPLLYTT